MNEIGLRIKKLRTFRGLTQEEVASKLFLSLKAYQNIEHGVTKLDFERIKKLTDIFLVTITDLIDNSEIKLHFDKPEKTQEDSLKPYSTTCYPMNLDECHFLLKEKANEIAFLKRLLNKFSVK